MQLIVRDGEGCAGFFQHNPENMLAFLLDPTMADLCNNRLEGHHDTMALKGAIYRKYFLLDPCKKYHGFENVLHLDDELRPELERQFGAYNAIDKTPYSMLIADLSP